jgi:hypothetical protein
MRCARRCDHPDGRRKKTSSSSRKKKNDAIIVAFLLPRSRWLLFSLSFAMTMILTSIGNHEVCAYSSGAGSCDFDGVLHGLPSSKPQIITNEDFGFTLGSPGINVPGAVANVKISGKRKYKGFMVYAVDAKTNRPIGKWLKKDVPERAQIHPMCSTHATHDISHSKDGGQMQDVLPWVVPVDVPESVIFRVTVVEEYETWYAFEMKYERGSARAGGVEGVELIEEDVRKMDKDGNKAPSLGAALSGGYAPTVRSDDDSGEGEEDTPREAFRKRQREQVLAAKDPDGTHYKAKHGEMKKFHKSFHNKLAKGGENRDVYIADPKLKAKKASDRVSEETKALQRRTIGRVAHGACMFILWVVLAPASASIARYGKGNATGWFTVHKSLSAIVLYGTLFGIFGVLFLRGFSTPWGPHGTFGLKTLGLCVVQMTLGNIRNWIPRPIFRFFHRWLGVATILLGWYTCSLGARLLSNVERMLKVPAMTHGGMFLILVFVWLMQRNHSKSRIDTKTRFSV